MPDSRQTVYRHELVVRPDELDGLGHANNIVYLTWMQDAAVAHSAACGWDTARYLAHGVGWVVRRHEIEYLSPALAGERLAVLTWVATLDRLVSLRRYEVVHPAGDRLLARAATEWVFINLAKQRPTRVLQEVRDAFVIDSRTSFFERL